MELEFDKEIDAMLRKARSGIGATAVIDAPHLDADAIAAFVDNALPAKVKLLYTGHLADCGRCRRLLSKTVLMNEGAASTDAEAAETFAAPVHEASWWPKILRTPNLALAMGALVLTFSGILGYLVLTNRDASSNVAQVDNRKSVADGQLDAPGAAAPAADVAANVATQSSSSAANSNSMEAEPSPDAPGNLREQPTAESAVSGRSMSDPPTPLGGVPLPMKPHDCQDCGPPADEPAPPIVESKAASAPPVPKAEDKEKGAEGRSVLDSVSVDRKDSDVTLAKKRSADDYGGRNEQASPKLKTGPSRASGNAQQQVQSNNTYTEPRRSVSGKTFTYRNGAWYDAAYSGQGTREIKRGSDKYKELDAGLRNSVEQFGGKVVIVWGSKAYKIY